MENQVPFSPVALVGTIALLAAYLLAAWAVTAGILGNARRSRRLVNSSVYALYSFAAFIALASAMLIYAFVTHDFTIKYVASNGDVAMSIWYKVTAFWGGLDGSLLFWVFVLALFSTIAIAVNVRKHRDMIGYVVATIMVVQVFFLSLLLFTKNPFATYLVNPPSDGTGLNPLLQNYWMVIHPPSLYIGFVSATIPFAFGIGALASGRLDDLWLGSVRVWMLLCFGFLSLGLILGGRWAYEELGWGGYWAWDPVENAGFIPWFTATAFLHSAIIQEQRGGMKVWNISLVVLTFLLTVFGTFMTRSGIVQSVHAFGEDNVLALQFVLFMAFVATVSIGLIVHRVPQLAKRTQFESFVSREFAFLVNNWILLVCAFFVLFATMFPTISEALNGERVTVGVPFFNRNMTFLGLVLLLLAGAAPLLAWRKTTTERLLNQFAVPAGCAVLVMAVLALLVPAARHLSPLFHPDFKLPMALITFGFCVFTFASVAQEFIRGMMVRIKQTNSDPFSATLGLLIIKRRKYGGYIVHFGVALMFLGFAGKAYDRDLTVTVQQPLEQTFRELPADQQRAFVAEYIQPEDPKYWEDVIGLIGKGKLSPDVELFGGDLAKPPVNSPSTFEFGDYTFVFEQLLRRTDDLKTSVTAKVTVWVGDERIATEYPASWAYHKGAQATTEVSIHVRPHEDVYITLSSFKEQQANFQVFINPLILWVWLGFIIIAIGTLICLIPQFVVDAVTRPPSGPSKIGHITMVALVATGLIAAAGGSAAAQGAGEHVPSNSGMGAGGNFRAENRPDTPTAERVMKDVICICGCPREAIYDCKCERAAQLRSNVMGFINAVDPATGRKKFDLESESGRDAAYAAAIKWYMETYDGERVLVNPRGSAVWLVPTLAVLGGFTLLVVVGMRFIRRGRAVEAAVAPVAAVEDEALADKLDDELAKTD